MRHAAYFALNNDGNVFYIAPMPIHPQRLADLQLAEDLRAAGMSAEADELLDAVRAKRWMAICRSCDSVMTTMIRPSQLNALRARGEEVVLACTYCGQPRKAKPIEGTYSEHRECNDACMFARGPVCDCSCGGANHGGGFSV